MDIINIILIVVVVALFCLNMFVRSQEKKIEWLIDCIDEQNDFIGALIKHADQTDSVLKTIFNEASE